MTTWPLKQLGDVLHISNERVEPTDTPDREFAYVGLENIEGHSGRLLATSPTLGADIKSTKNVFRSGEILYGKLRPYLNKVHLAESEGICSTDILVMRPQECAVLSAYATYFLRSPEVLGQVTAAMVGANLPRISPHSLLAIQIPVPPLAEQERIVKLLDEADALRKLRAQADQRTAQLIPALFHEMFGDPAINPMGWPVRPLHALTESFGGGTPCRDKPSLWGGDIKWVTPTELKAADQGVGLIFETRDHITDEGLATSSARLLPTGTVLFSSRATIGKVAIATVPLATNQGFVNFVPSSSVDPGYLATALWMVREDIASLSGSTTFKEVSRGVLRNYCLPVPPRNVQDAFAGYVADIRQLQSGQTVSRDRSDSVFQSMLDRAFAGEL